MAATDADARDRAAISICCTIWRMATDNDLACLACKVSFWIGRNGVVFRTDRDRNALEAFLEEHRGHDLRYDYSAGFEPLGFIQLDREDMLALEDTSR